MHPVCFRDRDLNRDHRDRRRVHDEDRLDRRPVHRERRRGRFRVRRRDHGRERACSVPSSSASRGWDEVRPGEVPDGDRPRIPHLRRAASGRASAFPAKVRTGCCRGVRPGHPDRPGRRSDRRAWGHGRASAFPARERRGCFRDVRHHGHRASGHQAWVLRAWARQPASGHRASAPRRQPAWTRLRAWPGLREPRSVPRPSRRLAWRRASVRTSQRGRHPRRGPILPKRQALQRPAWQPTSRRAWVRASHRVSGLRASRPAWRPSSRRWTSHHRRKRNRRMPPSRGARRALRASKRRSERIRPCPGAFRGRSYLLCRALWRAHGHGALPQFSCPGSFPVRKEPHQ